MTEYLNVGKIVNTQGIRGEVRVIPAADFPEEYYKKRTVLTLFQDGKAPIELAVRSHRRHKNFDLLSFEGRPSTNSVEKYRGGISKVSKDNSMDLDEDEFYYHEITGLRVVEEDGARLGKIKEILSPGANDVWVVQRPKKADILLSYIASAVRKISLGAGMIRIEIPEGLIDDED